VRARPESWNSGDGPRCRNSSWRSRHWETSPRSPRQEVAYDTLVARFELPPFGGIGRFSIGIRNSHDRSMRLAAVVGVRVLVCANMAFSGDFQPVLAKHSKNFSLQNALSIGVDQMRRNFDGMRKQVEAWRQSQLPDEAAKLIIYRAFIKSDLEVPKHLAQSVHGLYFHPRYEEFQSRTMWSLSDAFTSAFKELAPIPQFRATAKLAGFLERHKVGMLSSGRTEATTSALPPLENVFES